jgi:DNA-binding beta-propeller fold protein YncE
MHLVSIVAALASLAAGNLQEPNGAYVTTLTLSGELPGQGRLGGVAVDADGAIYVSNFGATVWRVDPDGTVTALTSDLRGSSGNAVMPDGSLLQASFLDNRIVRIARDGTSRTYATGFSGPVGIAVSADGTAFVCNCKANSISRVAPDGSVSPFVQSDLLDCPNGIVIDQNGDFMVTSFKSPTLVRIGASGGVERWIDVMEDGNAHLAWLGDDLYVTKVESNRIYRVTPDGAVSLFAGTGEPGDRDGPALEAQLAHPNGIAAVPGGNSLIVNTLVGAFRADSPTRLSLRKISLTPQ